MKKKDVTNLKTEIDKLRKRNDILMENSSKREEELERLLFWYISREI